jgi:hypothetical protein
LEKIAEDLGGRWCQQFQAQAEATVERLREAEQKRETGLAAQFDTSEERLTKVFSAVEALEGRVGALVEGFQGRLEGTLQALQGTGSRQAEDLEKIAEDLGGRWCQQFQAQAEAAVERLREAEQKRETGFVAQAEAAEERLAKVSVAVEALEGRVGALVEDFHGRIEHTLQAFQWKGARQAEDLEKIAEDLGRRWSQQFQEQAKVAVKRLVEELKNSARVVEECRQQFASLAEAKLASLSQTAREEYGQQLAQASREHAKVTHEAARAEVESIKQAAEQAVAQLREEVRNSVRVVEESKQQLASLTKSKLAVLSQVADNAAAGLEAEQTRLKNQYDTSRKELEDRLGRGWTRPSYPPENWPARRGRVARLALVAGLCLVIIVPLLGVYLSTRPVMRLQPEAPAEFIDQSPNWSAKRRAREEAVAQAYWQVAVESLQTKYPFGSELPADPPTEFQIENKSVPPVSAKAFAETRARYWEKLRRIWVERQSWVEHLGWNTQWTDGLRHLWDHLRLHKQADTSNSALSPP